MKLNAKLFKSALIAGMAILTFSACSAELSEREEILSKEYQLEEITWKQLPGDETSCRVFDESREVISEKNGTEYIATFFPLEDYKQSSQFFSDDPEVFMHLASIVFNKISIPSETVSLVDDISLVGGVEVPFLLDVHPFEPDVYSKGEIALGYPFKLQGSSTIEEYQIIATYRASFKEVNSERKIEITGKWKGVFYRCKNSVCANSPLSLE